MYKTLEDIQRVINKHGNIDVIKEFINLYLQGKQYQQWLDFKQQEYNQQYPEYDQQGNLIEYTDQQYTIDENGNQIENSNYKPSFEEWLFNKSQQWVQDNPTSNPSDNPYIFTFDEDSITQEDLSSVKEVLILYVKKYYLEIKPLQGLQSATINTKINCTRVDLDNMKNLLDDMVDEDLESTQFRVYDNSFVEVTQDQLTAMIKEVRQYGKQLYALKWQAEQAIQNASTLDELRQALDQLQ